MIEEVHAGFPRKQSRWESKNVGRTNFSLFPQIVRALSLAPYQARYS